MITPHQEPWDLEAQSGVRCSYALSRTSRNPRQRILTVRYRGLYRIGCQGAPDADYMRAMAAAALVARNPDGLIFDFTELDYRWGDDLERLYGIARDLPYPGANLPYALVLGKHCCEAVISLECQGHLLQEPAEWMFDTFDEAWRYVDDRIRA